jgi:anti-anti-sigma regulatory factor
MSLSRTIIIESRGSILSMRHQLDQGGAIVMTADGDGPVDPVQFRESAIGALTDHPDAGLTIDFTGSGRIDAATLAVIAQCWLALSERERELVVIPGDPSDRPVLERLGFDDFYRVADAA